MDLLASELQSFLIRLGREPHCVSHKVEHYVEHILHLLPTSDEEDLKSYFGLFGNEQLSIYDIAERRNKDAETTMETIDRNLHKLAITPEWQTIKQFANTSSTTTKE
ncbi:MAG TPA: hypothetical protein VIQ97_00875 [Prevotella sp.]